jgi:hypothetical protein
MCVGNNSSYFMIALLVVLIIQSSVVFAGKRVLVAFEFNVTCFFSIVLELFHSYKVSHSHLMVQGHSSCSVY